MENHTKNPSRNTALFSSLPPAVAVLILDVIHAVYSILAWRQSSKNLLGEILSRLAETESFEQTHDDFCAALWPYLEKNRRKEKISRWVSKLKADMDLSKFKAVQIPKQKVIRGEEGGFKGCPTVYKAGHFWKLFRYVQDESRAAGLLDLPVKERRAHIRVFVAKWLEEAGAEKIDRAKKADEIKPAKPTLPCSCACISCQGCSAKAPVLPSSLPSSEPVLSVQIEEEKKKLRLIEDELVAIGQRRLNRGNKLSIVDNKLNAVSVAARMRIKAAHARSGKNGSDLAPDTGARARGRAGLELMSEGLRDAVAAAEEMGFINEAEEMKTFSRVLDEWAIFQNRRSAR